MERKEILKNPWIRGFGVVLGTLVLGGLGSGFWELLLKPGLYAISDTLLNIASLGMNTLKDSSYRTIAAAHDDRFAAFTHLILVCMVFMFAVAIFARSRGAIVKYKKKLRRLEQAVDLGSNTDMADKGKVRVSEALVEYEDAAKEAKSLKHSIKLLPRLSYTNLVISLATILILASEFVRSQYELSAVTHYKQMVAITSPYISESERLEIHSKFAQIKTKNDYVEVINRLNEVAKENSLTVPSFDIW